GGSRGAGVVEVEDLPVRGAAGGRGARPVLRHADAVAVAAAGDGHGAARRERHALGRGHRRLRRGAGRRDRGEQRREQQGDEEEAPSWGSGQAHGARPPLSPARLGTRCRGRTPHGRRSVCWARVARGASRPTAHARGRVPGTGEAGWSPRTTTTVTAVPSRTTWARTARGTSPGSSSTGGPRSRR